ncbi:GGDEF domain-containing protein [Undibacterium pigrum]|uniref:diguanylate cyclase n=1 Tax=Undibacterium pigrum TaxID=401470 RepID=A0A318ITQ3_9BURK|nr:GGDEF domain-containing protein [Undibacterium pigrum]PXX37980.1 diguanylate cyclase (GGDEF)-like protein [Undibacterium pigrum]
MLKNSMLRLHRNFIIAACVALISFIFLYAYMGTPKPFIKWKWMDIVGEGGTSAMSGLWLLIMLSSRPKGLVTRLFAFGLAAIMLGSWADCLDEFFAIPKEDIWDNLLESMLVFAGMLIVTAGMYYWREEQFTLNEHLQKRERLFRDHRAFDRVTQLSNADYLRLQIKLELESNPGKSCALVLLDIDQFHLINRQYGQHEGDRVLQAVSHMLLLNLHNQDVLCRYAGDRFALVLHDRSLEEAEALALHLCHMVRQMRYCAQEQTLTISMRHACTLADDVPDTLLARLSKNLEASAHQFTEPSLAAGVL